MKLIEREGKSLDRKLQKAISEWCNETEIEEENRFPMIMATLQCGMVDLLIKMDLCDNEENAIKEIINSFKKSIRRLNNE